MKVIDRYHLDGLKRKRTQDEAACTKTKRNLMALMDPELTSRRQISEALQEIDETQQVALVIIGEISDKYKS